MSAGRYCKTVPLDLSDRTTPLPRRAPIAPLYTARRHYPTARRIAASLSPERLRLRTKVLALVIVIEHACAVSTAMKAIGLARAQPARS